jgi:quinolinate synthase
MGYPLESMALWDPDKPDGGLSRQELAQAKFILWNGYCSVHQIFREADVQRIRNESPQTTIIVHPECCFEVVQKSDRAGSTAQIIEAIEAAPAGASWAIGTEVNLVARLAKRHPDKQIQSLSLVQCLCATMYRVDPRHLLRSLQFLVDGKVTNRIEVDAGTAADARLALERMLEIK